MRKTFIALGFVLALAPAAWASAPELHNEDDKAYDYSFGCGGSKTSGRINPHTTTSLTLGSSGSCTLLVKGAGLGKLAPNVKCTIKGGSLTCK
jgi:hypothetical protein